MKSQTIIIILLFLVGVVYILDSPVRKNRFYTEVNYNEEEQIVEINNAISSETHKKIQSIGFENINKMILNSNGGQLNASVKIAKEIYKHKIQTYVPENAICFSGCVLLFQSGYQRTAHSSAVFMIHNVIIYDSLKMENIKVDNFKSKVFFETLNILGMSPKVTKLLDDYDQIYLDAYMAEEYNIVQSIEL